MRSLSATAQRKGRHRGQGTRRSSRALAREQGLIALAWGRASQLKWHAQVCRCLRTEQER